MVGILYINDILANIKDWLRAYMSIGLIIKFYNDIFLSFKLKYDPKLSKLLDQKRDAYKVIRGTNETNMFELIHDNISPSRTKQ